MRNIYKKAASLLLVTMILLSMVVTGAVAEAAAPTEVKSCEVSGFMPETLNLEFADTTWMNAITGVTVNGTSYTKGDLGWGASGTLWNVGSATGAYGSYTALKIVNPDSYPATLEITAEGYNTITVNVEKNVSVYPYTYTATVKNPEVEPSTPPTEPEEDKDAPTDFTVSASFGYDFDMTFTDAAEWLSAITDVQIDGTSWKKVDYTSLVYDNAKYYVNADDGRILIGEGFVNDTAVCVITAEGYKPLTLTLNKTNHTAVVGHLPRLLRRPRNRVKNRSR